MQPRYAPEPPTAPRSLRAQSSLTLEQWRALITAFDSLGSPDARARLLAHVLVWCELDADGQALAAALVTRLQPRPPR